MFYVIYVTDLDSVAEIEGSKKNIKATPFNPPLDADRLRRFFLLLLSLLFFSSSLALNENRSLSRVSQGFPESSPGMMPAVPLRFLKPSVGSLWSGMALPWPAAGILGPDLVNFDF